MKAPDETGKVYGRWTVLSRASPTGGTKAARAQWNCRCACGKAGIVYGDHLRLGRSTSCGCSKRERSSKQMHSINAKRREATRLNPPPPKVTLPRCEFIGVCPKGRLKYRGPNLKRYEESPRCRGIASYEMPDGARFCYMHAMLGKKRRFGER